VGLSLKKIIELQQVCREATDGPWIIEDAEIFGFSICHTHKGDIYSLAQHIDNKDDVDFFMSARKYFHTVLAELRRERESTLVTKKTKKV